jgi:uncharacterized protein YecE (DUF72 family)
MAGKAHIGTSGWQYRHWRGEFYPEKLPQRRWLEHYTANFDTVELNTTFYRLPPPTSVERWRDSTPDNFCFAAKGSRFLTHMKKFKDPAAGIERFFEHLEPLAEKLGPIVFQTPPFWAVDLGRLEGFLRALPKHHQYAFELRNPTWHSEPVYDLLRKHNAAFCLFEIAGAQSPREITADFTYVRLHGPGNKYQGLYSEDTLRQWARQITTWLKTLRGVYLYFDNDEAGYAAQNAMDLKRLVELKNK